MNIRKVLILIWVLVLTGTSACSVFPGQEIEEGPIEGSGFVSARKVEVASELGGKVLAVLVEEGEQVRKGDLLLRLDDDLYQAQLQEASAAVEAAEVAVESARSQLENARLQADLTLQEARRQEQPARSMAWMDGTPDEFTLPVWYYAKAESLTAAQNEVDEARENLDKAQVALEKVLGEVNREDVRAAEEDIARTRMTYEIAQETLAQAQSANDERLEEKAQEQVDSAQADLERAQLAYDQLLSSTDRDEVLDARARVSLARARYDNALDALQAFQTGEEALQVEAAEAGVVQAEVGVRQAEANLKRARAAVKVLETQIQKTEIHAPAPGVVLARNLEEGEVIGAGSPLLVVGQLDPVELVIYVPEDRYGQISIGQEVEVRVDSFPEEVFTGSVIAIADEAEFTPRNVQTVDGRKSTVYAVTILVPNPAGKLKPGMPADARLEE